jgi:hypothetical protein
MEQRAIFIVRSSISPQNEEAFNRWYNEDHFQKVIKSLGVIGGQRYKILETGSANLRSKIEGEERFGYMAIYEHENWANIERRVKSGYLEKMVAEFTAAWPESERLWIKAVQIYP